MEKANYYVEDIVWDIDLEGETYEEAREELELPTLVRLPEKLSEELDAEQADDEDVADYLSDTFGFCICSFKMKKNLQHPLSEKKLLRRSIAASNFKGEKRIKNKVIMSGQFEMSVPGFDKDRDSLLFGGYNVTVNGKEVPFDFYGMSWNIGNNGDKVTVDFESGRNFINTDNTLDDVYEETYAEQGFTISDITAEFLSQCTEIREFFVSLDIYRDGEWDELGPLRHQQKRTTFDAYGKLCKSPCSVKEQKGKGN